MSEPTLSSAAQRVIVGLRGTVRAARVMVANARARKLFEAQVLGRFERLGPNAWDDYQFTAAEAETIEVWPTVKLQVEHDGAIFRLRHRGAVVLAEWLPTVLDQDDRTRFLHDCVDPFGAAKGSGVASFVARSMARSR